MRICTSDDCRHRNPDHARYCARCGKPTFARVIPPANSVTRPKDSGFGGILVIILLVWFLSGLGGLGYAGCGMGPVARMVLGGCG
jgi:hypothetical protein